MKRKWRMRLGAMLISISLVVGLIPDIPGNVVKVQAATLGVSQFATKDQLLSNFKLDGSAGASIGRISFGASGRRWVIAGRDVDNSLALLSTNAITSSSFGTDSKYSTSLVLNILSSYTMDGNTTYFSASEKTFMKNTTVSTLEWDQGDLDEMRKVTSKLYLPDALNCMSYGDNKIYVGSANNIGIALSNLTFANGFSSSQFWLRSPNQADSSFILVARPGDAVYMDMMAGYEGIVPAFNLDMSSVLFGSVAPYASATGALLPQDSMVLRYSGAVLGTATINRANTNVTVTETGEKTYLVVQNAEGAWAKDVSSVSGSTIVSASDVTINSNVLSSLSNCKVWLETTNTTERITTATMAVQGTGKNVTVTPGSNMTKVDGSGNLLQTDLTGIMTNVVFNADTGYYFPEDYSVTGSNGITVTRNSFTQITVSGTPISDATIALISPTKKADQAAPTGLSDGGNKILGTTTEMEYASTLDAVTWISCSDSYTEVSDGTWYVRYKETPTKEVGTPTSVIVTIPIPKYTVSVNYGAGDGEYQVGETVYITADTAPSGMKFKNWLVVSGGITLANDSNATTTFTMPANVVEVSANYEDVAQMPRITSQPIDATLQEGNTATFTIVEAGTDPLTYQWKINRNDGLGWVNISAATAASYTTSAVDMNCNGFQYKCIVTNAAGMVESDVATLTVTKVPVTKYTVTVHNSGNGTASANVTQSAAGSKVSLTATAKNGYEFKEWQVISGGVTIVNNSFIMPSNNVVIKAIFVQNKTKEDKDYSVTKGKDQTVVLGRQSSAIFRINAAFNKFLSVYVDGRMISREHYTAQAGSTIITLKPEYLATLSLGKHTITVNFTDGSAQTSLEIKKADNNNDSKNDGKDDVPKTGDSTKAGWLYVIALTSGGILLVTGFRRKRRAN